MAHTHKYQKIISRLSPCFKNTNELSKLTLKSEIIYEVSINSFVHMLSLKFIFEKINVKCVNSTYKILWVF